MAINPKIPGWALRPFQRIAQYFRAVQDPTFSRPRRALSFFKGCIVVGVLGAILLVIYTLLLIPFTPSVSDLRKLKTEQPTIVFSGDGKRLAKFQRLNREWVELDRVSPHIVKALIATEDHRFYEHHGIDLKRTASAVLRTLMGDPEGGSTITQQLARNLYPEEIGRQRNVTRKLKELITAFKIEYSYSKQDILVTYLNTMPFLYNTFGIEMAAHTYFDKPAAKLNIVESATLIGMLKGTSYYNPVLNPKRAVERRNVVLAQMAKHAHLSQADLEKYKKRPLRLDFERPIEQLSPAQHFAEHIRKWLVNWADQHDYDIYADGLKVYTTVDSRLQAVATQAVRRQLDALQAVADVEWASDKERLLATGTSTYVSMRRRIQPFEYLWQERTALVEQFIRESEAYRQAVDNGASPEIALADLKNNAEFMTRLRDEKTRLQAGFVAIDPSNGYVKAWVGSRGYMEDKFDHVIQAKRQPGSTFKPLVYAAALEQGMSPRKRFTDYAVEIPLRNGTVWRPRDASAPTGEKMTAREGLVYSKNTITAQVMQEVGPDKIVALAQKAGISDSKLEAVPSLALGASPVTLFEMAAAYSTIAAVGVYHPPILIRKITDRYGNVLASFEVQSTRVMPEESTKELIDMLRGVVDEGTGHGIRTRFGITADVAGKTGTTQNNTDGWFMLMHPKLVAGSWVGFNDARITMRSNYWGQGAQTALPVVGDFFRQTLNARLINASAQFPRPPRTLMDSIRDTVDEIFNLKW